MGRTRQLRGDSLVPIEFEVDMEHPDRYVRREEIPAQGSGPVARGFNGAALIQPPPAGPRGAAPPAAAPAGGRGRPAPDALAALRQDLVRLLLGLTASSMDVLPVEFRYVGTAEAPEGLADALDVADPSTGFAARLFITQRDHLPVLVSWPAEGAPPGTPDNRLYFADFREVQGLRLPHRIRRGSGVVTSEETTVDRYKVNPAINRRRFEVKP
jgi:hypothetical protein